MANSRNGDFGEHLIFLAFSGGGTRAAALSYGVLKELRDTQVDARRQRVRLLDEVDSISSVSGGSFTAAYYGLFGDKTFTDYEKAFLRQSIQGTLIRMLFSPLYWWDSIFKSFDRTEMAIDYYDSQIFEGKTFADFNLQNTPFIEINATDLAAGNRFSFIQAAFDLICSDLDKFSVARAVTASSAVPVAFPTVVLKNYAGECDSHRSNIVKQLNARSDNDPRTRRLKERVNSYLDRKARPYIHLVDGGIVDNLGLRALADRIKTQGSGFFLQNGKPIPKDVLVITVNAQVKPERSMDISANKPSVSDTINAMSDAQMSLYNDETKLLLQNKLDELKDEVNAQGLDVKFHTAEVSFDSVEAKTMKSFLNSLPTSLELSDQDVDILIDTAAQLLRRSPGYRKFLELNGGNRLKGTAGSTTTATAH
ncbi:MAG: patatin-like phospholipase family protein [Methylococcaceae bacterium]|nr:patatin-like phospholipase family protein [Methylococcaceae bacterium]